MGSKFPKSYSRGAVWKNTAADRNESPVVEFEAHFVGMGTHCAVKPRTSGEIQQGCAIAAGWIELENAAIKPSRSRRRP